MTRYESVLETIGGTPLVRLTRSVAGLRPRVYVKCEWQNPGGSVKDRAALAMLRRAEADGSLRPGGTVVEVTSGNTGIGLALVAAHLGYRAVIFTSSTIALEKRSQITAYGAELRLVDRFVPKDHPDSLRSTAERFVAGTPGAWLAAQYDNPANPAAHEVSTGPEIWADTDGGVTHLVATVGTGGTISGTAHHLKRVSGGRVRVIGADPVTSSYSGGDGSQKFIEGAGHFVHPEATVDPWPLALDLEVIDDYVTVDDQRAIDAIRWLSRTEGILAGGSSGIALAAALQVAEGLAEDDVVVVLLPDSGRTYLSTYFDDAWLAANGFGWPGREAPTATTVGERARPAVLVAKDELVADVLARPVVRALGPDDVVLVVHRRDHRVLAPHPSDVVGWTSLAALTDAAPAAGVVADAVAPVTKRLGAGLALDDPAVAGWDGADEGIALVLERGRVAGTVWWEALFDEAVVDQTVPVPPSRVA